MRPRGLTLLEILVASMLLATLIMAAGGIFVRSSTLNRSNSNKLRGNQLAQAILEELSDLPVNSYSESEGLRGLQDWRPGTWEPGIEIPTPFYLPENPAGIKVEFVQHAVSVGTHSMPCLARITVTIAWEEKVEDSSRTNFVTVETWRSINVQR